MVATAKLMGQQWELIGLITSAASFVTFVASVWPSAITTSTSGGSEATLASVASIVASTASAFDTAFAFAIDLEVKAFD